MSRASNKKEYTSPDLHMVEEALAYFERIESEYDGLYEDEKRLSALTKSRRGLSEQKTDVQLAGILAVLLSAYVYTKFGVIAAVSALVGILALILIVPYFLRKKDEVRKAKELSERKSRIRKRSLLITDYYIVYRQEGKECVISSPRYTHPKDLRAALREMKKHKMDFEAAYSLLRDKLHLCMSLPMTVVTEEAFDIPPYQKEPLPDSEPEPEKGTSKEEPQHTDEPVFFKGITDLDTLKSRYRKLMKAYHTDEATGDTETAELINEEYEYMKKLLTDKQKQERPA